MKLQLWAAKEVIKKCTNIVLLMGLFIIVKYAFQPLILFLYKNGIRYIGNGNIESAIVCVMVWMISEIISARLDNFNLVLDKKLQFSIDNKFFNDIWKSLDKKDITFWDKSENIIKLERAKKAVEENFGDTIISFFSIIGMLGSLFVVAILIVRNDPLYLFAFVTMSIIQNIFVSKYNRQYVEMIKQQEPFQRKHNYFNSILRGKKYIKELRVLQKENWIEKKREVAFQEIKNNNLKFSIKWTTINLFWALMMFGIEGIFYGIIMLSIINGMGVENAVFLIESQTTVIDLISNLIQKISGFNKSRLYINEYKNLVNQDDNAKLSDNYILEDKNIAVKAININYAYKCVKVLQNVELEIKIGERIAIIGENGSGKSTLAKIIAGLIIPSEGDIFCKGKVSAVFQDFSKFYTSIRENVAFGNLNLLKDDKVIYEAINNASGGSGFNRVINLDTFIGTEYEKDSIDLSGGEWQKIACARAIIKEANIIIFDEATAALDAISELNQYYKIKDILEGKTIITITHRVGMAKEMDKIFYLENGKVREKGSHYDLMKKKGKYYTLYLSQANWYEEGYNEKFIVY